MPDPLSGRYSPMHFSEIEVHTLGVSVSGVAVALLAADSLPPPPGTSPVSKFLRLNARDRMPGEVVRPISSPSSGREPDVGRPAASQASTVRFRSMRLGASGRPPSKSAVSIVFSRGSFDEAALVISVARRFSRGKKQCAEPYT